MPLFDTRTFLELTGKGSDPVQSIGTAFGMPACLLNLSQEVMQLLPSNILTSLRGSTSNGANRADDVIKAVLAKMRFLGGIIEYDTDTGTFRFVSDTSKFGNDRDEGNLIKNLTGFLGATAGFAGRLYNNYNATRAQLEDINSCIGNYKKYLQYSAGGGLDAKQELANLSPSAYLDMVNSEWAADKANIQEAQDFIDKANSLLTSINDILLDRSVDPSLEPEFNSDALNLLSGAAFQVGTQPPTSPTEVFRLAFLPPKSKNGQFKLSQDGVYFDSQSSGLMPALLEVARNSRKIKPEHKWTLDYAPNIGGRGTTISSRDVLEYVNTILDPDIVDESVFMEDYYDTDRLLTEIIGQKNKRIFDLSSQLTQLEDGNASESLTSNWQQVILSENSFFLQKVNKRKKQIELAIKIPSIYGSPVVYQKGHIPINDFSYMQGLNLIVDIQNQRKLVLDQQEVSGVVLPLQPVYVISPEHESTTTLDHLLVTDIGTGSIITDGSSVSSVSTVDTISLTPVVVTDSLFAIYNYLQSDTTNPSSTDFNVFNSIGEDKYNNAQLVSYSPSNVFETGLGLAWLQGITKNSSINTTQPSGVGTYIRLPDTTEFRDFMYKKSGATFETWMYLPNFDNDTWGYGDGDASGLYRIILANENTGIKSNVPSQADELKMSFDMGDSVVRGMIMGFTRDRRFTQNSLPSNLGGLNPAENARFVIAPTQSFDSSTVGFINRTYYDTANCASGSVWHSMNFDAWQAVNGKCLSSAGREFVHLVVTFDPVADLMGIYCDGQLLTTSSLSYVFGVRSGQMPKVPSFKKQNSFEYNASNVNVSASNWLAYGPKLDRYFTPWILGGGYTDGIAGKGFMGGTYGGNISGFKGFVGSTKFYYKPLTPSEVLNNYNAQSVFFKNIDLPNEMWEPIIVT